MEKQHPSFSPVIKLFWRVFRIFTTFPTFFKFLK